MNMSMPSSPIDARFRLAHTNQPPTRRCDDVIDDTGWPFTNDDDLFSIESDALDVQVDFGERQLIVQGEIVRSTVDTLVDLACMLIDGNPGITSVDLRSVSRIDAAGFANLVDISDQLNALGAELIVIGPKPHLDRLFDVSNLLAIVVSGAGRSHRPDPVVAPEVG